MPILLLKMNVMWRVIYFFFLFAFTIQLKAQVYSGTESIKTFLGVDSYEDLDVHEVERLEEYIAKPLHINFESFAEMVSSGLLSQYQVASLMDYRNRSGDILSLSELSLINGFNPDFVRKLSPFISLASSSNPGMSSAGERKSDNDLTVRSGFKPALADKCTWNWGAKYRLKSDRGAGGSISVSKSYDEPGASPEFLTGNFVFKSIRRTCKLVIGDFNARFGQGLALWNGMTMSGLSSLSSFSRRGSGISESWSFTGSSALTGIAAGISSGRFIITSLAALPGIRTMPSFKDDLSVLPAVNVLWYGRNFQVSVTECMEFSGVMTDEPRIPHMKTSADVRCCLKGTDIFTEIAYDWVNTVPAFLMGSEFPASEFLRMAVLARYYPSAYDSYLSAAPRSGSKCANELALSLAGELSVRRHECSFSIDAMAHPESKSKEYARTWQVKSLLLWRFMINEQLTLAIRLNERIRNWESNKYKTDARMEVNWLSRSFTASVRINLSRCVKTGFLSYMEAGYKGGTLSIYFRQGFFHIDNWDDRIYAYERDAPGNFSVPAYYGRGLWSALTGSWRFSGWGKLYARASMTSYPFMKEKKPGKAELKLQLSVSF